MPTRILLVWELGGGSGHLLILGQVAEALRKRGHDPAFALKSQDRLGLIANAVQSCDVWAAPRWTDFAAHPQWSPGRRSATLADNLAQLGLHSSSALHEMLMGWDRLFAECKPDVIVADYAPACLMAAHRRIPTVAVGDPYKLPPVHISQLPNLDAEGRPPLFDEATLLGNLNDGLRAAGRAPLRSVPEIFLADHHCVGTFTELDPYAKLRTEAVAAPWIPDWNLRERTGGDEVFAYFSWHPPIQRTLYQALANVAVAGLPVRVHASSVNDELLKWLTANGIAFEPLPVPFTEIQARSRLLISHGSFNFACCALVAGLPHLVTPVGLDKDVTARSLETLGTGRRLPVGTGNPFEPALLAQAIIDAYNDDELQARAKRLAPSFAQRLGRRPGEIAADYVEELL